MNEKDICKFIVDLESQYEVEKWVVDGIHIWPLVRLAIGESIYFSEQKSDVITDKPEWWVGKNLKRLAKEFFRFLKLYISDYKNNAKYDGEEILCIVANGNRDIRIKNSGWYHHIINPIYDEINLKGKRIFSLEYFYGDYNTMAPRYNPSKIINIGILLRIIKQKIKILLPGQECLPMFDEVVKKCEKVGVPKTVFDVRNILVTIRAAEQYYCEMLRHKDIKLIIISDWRNTFEMGLTMAAKKLGLKCIEIWHGYYGPDSITHFWWHKQPAGGYEVRPDYYWCWTKKSAESMNGELINGKAIYGGIPYKLAWDRGLKSRIACLDINFMGKIPTSKKIVLFSLNPNVDIEEYPEWLLDVIRETNGRYFWLLRKHDRVKRQSGENAICEACDKLENVEWRYSSEVPLFQLLECADVHVTYDSSVVFEALSMGIKTIFLSKFVRYRYEEQIGEGTAMYIDNKKDMLEYLDKYCSTKIKVNTDINGTGKLLELLKE